MRKKQDTVKTTSYSGREWEVPADLTMLRRSCAWAYEMVEKYSQSFMDLVTKFNKEEIPNKLQKLLKEDNLKDEQRELIKDTLYRICLLEDRYSRHNAEIDKYKQTISKLKLIIKEYELPLHGNEPHMGWGEGCDKCLPWGG